MKMISMRSMGVQLTQTSKRQPECLNNKRIILLCSETARNIKLTYSMDCGTNPHD